MTVKATKPQTAPGMVERVKLAFGLERRYAIAQQPAGTSIYGYF